MEKGKELDLTKMEPTKLTSQRLEIRGSLLARNALLNFIGQAIPLLVGVITIPYIVRGLGTERFGLLSLAWVILGYFAIFDLGLGRATTKFVAEALGKDEEDEIPRIVWTAVMVQAVLGVVGALVLIAITPLLVERVLNIPAELIEEAKVTFYILAFSVPVVLISMSFSGVLEASQRFDLVNAIKIPSSTLTFLLPLVGVFLGFSLPGIVALILVARIGVLIAFIVMNFRIRPELKKLSASLSLFPRLFSFGGWVTVSSIAGPILVYLDRFLIGSLLSMSAVAYYSAPYEAVTRLWIIPASLTMTLFPAFSSLEGAKEKQKVSDLFFRSIKYVFFLLGSIVFVVVFFAEDILRVWLGDEFALRSTLVLQILALGVLINSLAHIPFALLQGIERPDIPAKFHLLELPIYIGIAWFLVSRWGIAGAATAWTFRVAFDATLLFIASFKVYQISPRLLIFNGTALAALAFLLLMSVTCGVKLFLTPLALSFELLFVLILLSFFTWFSWRNVLDVQDRSILLKAVKRLGEKI